MSSWVIALIVKPLVVAAFFALIYSLEWVLFKVIPEGKLKTALFKVRSRSRRPAAPSARKR